MEAFFGSIWWLIISLGILVTFHEFGHFWVARHFGVKVERFSVGFGRALWSRRGRDGTVYQIAAIPLGGYVKMLDERESEGPVAEPERAFNRKPVGARIAIVAAGPIFNLILCLGLLWLMFVIGKPEFQPLVGRSTGLAAEAGIVPGDRLLSVDGKPIRTWTHASLSLALAATDRRPVEVEVADGSGATRRITLPLDRVGPGFDETRVLPELGLLPRQWLLPARIGEVQPDSAAAAAGLEPGDRILAIDGRPVEWFDEIGPKLQDAMTRGDTVELYVERGADRFELTVRPRRVATEAGERWLLGIAPARQRAEYDTVLRHGPLAAIGAALAETRRLTGETLAMLWRMVTGRASLQNLSGPISIAQYANVSAQLGVAWFLSFLALLSLSLAIINLLPIPILDGGHLLYYLIELVKGSPVSEKALAAGQYVGLVMLAGLMGLAFYNDLLRLFG